MQQEKDYQCKGESYVGKTLPRETEKNGGRKGEGCAKKSQK